MTLHLSDTYTHIHIIMLRQERVQKDKGEKEVNKNKGQVISSSMEFEFVDDKVTCSFD